MDADDNSKATATNEVSLEKDHELEKDPRMNFCVPATPSPPHEELQATSSGDASTRIPEASLARYVQLQKEFQIRASRLATPALIESQSASSSGDVVPPANQIPPANTIILPSLAEMLPDFHGQRLPHEDIPGVITLPSITEIFPEFQDWRPRAARKEIRRPRNKRDQFEADLNQVREEVEDGRNWAINGNPDTPIIAPTAKRYTKLSKDAIGEIWRRRSKGGRLQADHDNVRKNQDPNHPFAISSPPRAVQPPKITGSCFRESMFLPLPVNTRDEAIARASGGAWMFM